MCQHMHMNMECSHNNNNKHQRMQQGNNQYLFRGYNNKQEDTGLNITSKILRFLTTLNDKINLKIIAYVSL